MPNEVEVKVRLEGPEAWVAERRIGEFLLPMDVLQERPGVVHKLLSGCLILKADWSVDPSGVRYTAYAPAFEPKREGYQPTLYHLDQHHLVEKSPGKARQWLARLSFAALGEAGQVTCEPVSHGQALNGAHAGQDVVRGDDGRYRPSPS